MASVNPWTPQPASNLFDPPGGGSNFGRPAGNPLGQQNFNEQMSVFPDGSPRPNTVYGNSVASGGQGGSQGGGQSSGQGGGQGWQPQQGTVSSGGDYRQQLLQMLMGANNNLSQAFGGGGQQTGQWVHNPQPAYWPYASNSGLGFGGGTAGIYLRPQQYIPGTQTTWAGDLPQANNITNWAGDRPFYQPPQQQKGFQEFLEGQAVLNANQEMYREQGKKNREDYQAKMDAIHANYDWKNPSKGLKERQAALQALQKEQREKLYGKGRMVMLDRR